jgi:hypothetical protein
VAVLQGKEVNTEMRKMIVLLVCVLFATSLIMVAGCAKKEEPPKPEPAKAEPAKVAEPEKKAEEAKPGEAAKPGEPAKPAEPAKAPEKK